jgi:cell division protein FtsL
MITWLLIITILNLVGIISLFYRLYQIEQRIDTMDKRIQVQIDSYGATVGEAVDYLDMMKEKGK